jgi:hypothetical protein
MEDSKERITPDWERIEADYRAGLLSLRGIAAKDGHVTEGAIRKKARKLEWARDLKARIQAKAEEMVRNQMVRSGGPQYATASEASERAIVQDNAQILANVELTQRRDISKTRQIVVNLIAELEAATGEISLPLRAGTAKVLADALRTLVGLERSAWRMDDGQAAPVEKKGYVIDSRTLTWQERQQFRQMLLKSMDEPAVIAKE